MKKIYQIFIFCFLVLFSNALVGQENKIKNNVSSVLKEQVYIHYNSSLLLVGEYVHYSMYCTYLKNQKPSSISKIGYVELVGEGNKIMVSQKVKLVNGLGRGDFFIPVSVPSGNYKIIGYTNWMKNNKNTPFFAGDINIVNPYQENQKINFIAEKKIVENNLEANKETTNKGNLSVKLSESVYKQRSKVKLSFFPDKKHINGVYSLSIYEANSIIVNSEDYSNNYRDFKDEKDEYVELEGNEIALPELRGELIKGSIKSINDTLPINNISVSISIPSSKGYFFKTSRTNSLGEFKFILDKEYDTSNAIIQVFNENKENYTITMSQRKGVNSSFLTYKNPSIHYSANQYIRNRSIHNQIENAYFELKPDSILIGKKNEPFTMENKLIYKLDEYTRFKTLSETLVEVVNNVWSKKVGNKYIFKVRIENRANDYFDFSNMKALVLVDGIVVQDHTMLMGYDARTLESISIVRSKYVYGEEIYQGIIEIATKKGDFELANHKFGALNYKLLAPAQHIVYYKTSYDKLNVNKHIPDFRYQLLWNPNIKFNDTTPKDIEFYTSDVTGKFKVTFRGFTEEGEEVLVEKYFKIE